MSLRLLAGLIRRSPKGSITDTPRGRDVKPKPQKKPKGKK